MALLKLYKTFKVAVPKVKRKRNNDGIKRTSNKIIIGKVFIDEEGIYKVSIDMKNDPSYPDLLVLEFTERSYELKGRTNVFGRKRDKHGHIVRYIRNHVNARYMPGLPEQYIPFAPNWIIKGYIVKENNLTKFDFKDLVGIDGYDMDIQHLEE